MDKYKNKEPMTWTNTLACLILTQKRIANYVNIQLGFLPNLKYRKKMSCFRKVCGEFFHKETKPLTK